MRLPAEPAAFAKPLKFIAPARLKVAERRFQNGEKHNLGVFMKFLNSAILIFFLSSVCNAQELSGCALATQNIGQLQMEMNNWSTEHRSLNNKFQIVNMKCRSAKDQERDQVSSEASRLRESARPVLERGKGLLEILNSIRNAAPEGSECRRKVNQAVKDVTYLHGNLMEDMTECLPGPTS